MLANKTELVILLAEDEYFSSLPFSFQSDFFEKTN